MRERPPLPTNVIGVIIAIVTLGPLAMITYLSVRLSSDSLKSEIETRLETTVSVSASFIGQQMESLTELVSSFASRPTLVEALERPKSSDNAFRVHLRSLRRSRAGLTLVFVAKPDGTLIDLLPETPSIVGDNFSYRDWYKGVVATEKPFVSRAYRSAAAGRPRVVAAAAPVWEDASRRSGRMIGILVAAYDLATVQRFAEVSARAFGIDITVTDRSGVVLAAPDADPLRLVSLEDDPLVAAGLQGRRGVIEHTHDGEEQVSAFAPIAGIRWVVTASLPADEAFADITSFRSTMLGVGAFYGLILGAGLIVLVAVLRQLSRERAKSDAILDSIGAGVLIADTSGRVVSLNRAGERLLGWTKNDAIGRVYSEVCRAFDAYGRPVPESERLLPKALSDKQIIETTGFNIFFETRDGRRIPVSITTAPITDTGHRVIGAVEVVRDVSREREVDLLKSSLVSTVSHELRTPLTIMQGFSELLLTREMELGETQEVAGQIHTSALRLSRLVDNLLSVSRIESGRFGADIETLDLNDIIEEVIAHFEHDGTHRFTRRLAGELPKVKADRDKLVQVLTNLISNAVKYSPAGSEVLVSTRRSQGTAVTSVADEGIGLSAEEREQLFEKFFRADRSEVRNVSGTGLGLYIAKSLIEIQSGQLWVDAREPRGTVFSFSLPLDNGPGATSAARDDVGGAR